MNKIQNNNNLWYDIVTPQIENLTLVHINDGLVLSIAQCNYIIANIINEQDEISWNSIITPLHRALYNLNRWWSILSIHVMTNNNQEIRELSTKFQPQVYKLYTKILHNQQVVKLYNIINAHEFHLLNREQQRVLEYELQKFQANGINLTNSDKIELNNIHNELHQLQNTFERNVFNSTNEVIMYLNATDLSGIPTHIIRTFNLTLEEKNFNKYAISLNTKYYIPIMKYCTNRQLRKKVYDRYVTRASDISNTEFDNTPIIHSILKLRHKKAILFGASNTMDLSLQTKSLTTVEQARNFILSLAKSARNKANIEIKELSSLANSDGISTLEAWDFDFYAEKLQKIKFGYSNEELSQYLSLTNVVCGTLKLLEHLYVIQFCEFKPNNMLDSSIQIYQVLKNNEIIGLLYLDLQSRNNKLAGARMCAIQNKFIDNQQFFKPIAYVICNFNQPKLLIDEIQTFFHEIGHAMHHILTTVNHFIISGTNGVEADALELPSQFMEYFIWSKEVLALISNNQIPEALLQKIILSKQFLSGIQMLRQLEFALFDVELHSNTLNESSYLNILRNVREKIAVVPYYEYDRFPNTFSHIFSGGYATSFYSYKWAEVMATDIFHLFTKVDFTEYPQLANKFLDTILSQGGLHPMLTNFKNLMGREPQIDALISYYGLEA